MGTRAAPPWKNEPPPLVEAPMTLAATYSGSALSGRPGGGPPLETGMGTGQAARLLTRWPAVLKL